MRIAFFLSAFPVISETFIVNQIVDFKRRGNRIRIYAKTRGKESIVHEQIVENNLFADTVFLDELPSKRFQKILYLMKELFRGLSFDKILLFVRFMKKAPRYGLSVYDQAPFLMSGFDVVHAHFGINGVYVSNLKNGGLFSKSRFITTFHGYDLEHSLGVNRSYNALFKTGDAFVVNSEFSKQKLLNLGCPDKKAWKVPVGLDVAIFNSNQKHEKAIGPIQILFVGRMISVKGPDIFIQICKLLRQRGVEFQSVMVGDGEERENLTVQILTAGLLGDIVMVGPKSQDAVRDLMSKADILLLPGRTINGRAETQGLVIQEAQAMRLPVLISDAGGMKEGMVDGMTGFVLPENDIAGFADKIELLADDPALRDRMGEAGRKLVEAKFDSTILNNRLLELYAN
jgi:colanic acid/amylovoran biosynthesis glycosyltransferase